MKLGLFRRKLAVIAALLACPLFVLLVVRWGEPGEIRSQRLEDGSVLVLTRVKFGPTNVFLHGKPLEKLLGNSIPPIGLAIAGFKLERPREYSFYSFLTSASPILTAEFNLVSTNTATFRSLAGSAFGRRARCVVGGETGITYVEDFRMGGYRDFSFAYIISSRFPRDSRWLSFTIEQRTGLDDPSWRTVASFRMRNPSRPAERPWIAEATPAVKVVKGLEFTLGEVTLETKPFNERDIWNHTVTLPVRVRTNNVTLASWSAARIEAEDASGNWGMHEDVGAFTASNDGGMGTLSNTFTNGWVLQRGERGLDPRFVWKLEMDFSPTSEFSPEDLHHFQIPAGLATPLRTNLAGVPLSLSWEQFFDAAALKVEMLTNRWDLRLLFVAARDGEGRNVDTGSDSWAQGGFVRFLGRGTNEIADVTVAIVPNVHVTYYVLPKLIPASGQNQLSPAQAPGGKRL